MPRLVSVLALLLATLSAPRGEAATAKACRAACMGKQRTCMTAANGGFRTARTACKPLTGADKKSCLKTARATRAAARKACGKSLASCRKGCAGGSGGGGGGGTGAACEKSSFGDWLATVNGYRALAGLPPVTENPAWSAGELAHSRYMVKTGGLTHAEDPTDPNFTTEGNEAGSNGNVAGSSDINSDDGWAVDTWVSAPFHAVGILDPRLAESAFGIFHEAPAAGKTIATAATLDVLRALTGSTSGLTYPILFPGNGTVMPLGIFRGNETPDPLGVCGYTATYTAPIGAPIIAEFASTPSVTASSLMRDGVLVDSCEIDEGKPLPGNGPAVLAARHAVIVFPKEPLKKGSKYDVSITNAGVTTTWSFTVNCS